MKARKFLPPIVNVFAIDTSGNQMQQRERNYIAAQGGPVNFGSHGGGKADSRSSRKGTDSRFPGEWLQLMSPSYQKAYHQFMETADSAIEFYDQFDRELEQMKAELKEFTMSSAKVFRVTEWTVSASVAGTRRHQAGAQLPLRAPGWHPDAEG